MSLSGLPVPICSLSPGIEILGFPAEPTLEQGFRGQGVELARQRHYPMEHLIGLVNFCCYLKRNGKPTKA